jgi:hypothetical protein
MKGSDTASTTQASDALIFIPDISGFTEFVTFTEINHAKHIIEELLSVIIDSNDLGLEVSEVEGDAILFYRFGKAPTADELMAQVKKIFTRFHQHLMKYETHRVCNCGACKTAHNLTIKFIAHYGEIAINQVQQFKKLFGKDVIVAHRLLKNEINTREYALFTKELTDCCPQWAGIEETSWDQLGHAEQVYDSGKVDYSFIPMGVLKEQLPPLVADDYNLSGKKSRIFEVESIIEAPMDLVFNVVSDLPWRSKWIPGLLPEIEEINSQITQAGQTHRCLANGPIIVGHDYSKNVNSISFTETDQKKTQSTVYILTKLSEQSTKVEIVGFMPRNQVKELILKLFFKKKILKIFDQSFTNLNEYCKGLVQRNEEHSYKVEID